MPEGGKMRYSCKEGGENHRTAGSSIREVEAISNVSLGRPWHLVPLPRFIL